MLLTRYAQIATTQDKANRYLVRFAALLPFPFSIFHFPSPPFRDTLTYYPFPRTLPSPNSITP